MKKVLLDICLFEVAHLRLEFLDESAPILQKLKTQLNWKLPKYPNGPMFTQAEFLKLSKFMGEYKDLRLDAIITNDILYSIAQEDIIGAIAKVKFTFDRLNGFLTSN